MPETIQLPELYTRRKLNALYRQIPMTDPAMRLLRKYFAAAANLYGVVPVRKLHAIVEEQNPGLVSLEDFGKFALIACHELEEYYILDDSDLYDNGRSFSILDREIVDVSLLDDGGEKYRTLKEGQRGKPYYVPPKKVFLSYTDPFWCEPSETVEAFRSFLKTTFQLSEARLEQVFQEMVYGTRCRNASPDQAAWRLQEMGLRLRNEREVHEFVSVFRDFYIHMRMQCHRGHTPLEMRTAPITKTQEKVGRNDPCPCGSGKKYKKCCGK
jgi:hypothetical protein